MIYETRYHKADHLWVVSDSELLARRVELSNLGYEHPSLGAEWTKVQDEYRLIEAELGRRQSES